MVQAGLSCRLFWTRQRVTRLSSGIAFWQSRIASGVQASASSWVREVTGIGLVRAKRITDAWAEQKIVREIMVFLHSHTAVHHP
jgi:hypothetical protein